MTAKRFSLLFLGTGTSGGVPMIGCKCDVCLSKNKKDKRLRSSVLLKSAKTTVVIDAGPDFRQQMLKYKVAKLDAVVFTHAHKDHIAGIDDIRPYNFFSGKPMPLFANEETLNRIKTEFDYAFKQNKISGVPELKLNEIKNNEPFYINDFYFEPLPVLHFKMPVLGYRINHKLVYITDANYISNEILKKIKGCEVLILNALRHEEHISHFNLNQAIEISKQVQPKKTFFTHMSYQIGLHDEINNELEDDLELAYDGCIIKF